MKIRWTRGSMSRVGILTLGIILGGPVGAMVLPTPFIDHIQSIATRGLEYSLAIIAIILFVLFGLAMLERMAAQQLEVDQELLSSFFEHVPDYVFFKDLQGRFLRVSHSVAKFWGLKDPKDGVSRTEADFSSAEFAAKALADEREIVRTGIPLLNSEEKATWKDGHVTWVSTTKLPLRDNRGQIVGILGIAHDITDRKMAELSIRHMALFDGLTGLPNRTLLDDQLSHIIGTTTCDRNMIAVFLLDLDCFQNVNDTFGHTTGDRLLEIVATRLKSCAREASTIARFCGDEFVVVYTCLSSDEDVQRTAKRLQDVIAETIEVDHREFQLACSIGVSLSPQHGKSAESLLQNADLALYEAKKKGRNRVAVFNPALTDRTKTQNELRIDLANAHARDEFQLHYQPIFQSETGKITGVEALLRWKHPKHGLISPDRFLPELEELGLMVEVGEWVLRTACRQAHDWNSFSEDPIRVAVNVSSSQFQSGNLVEAVELALREAYLDPKYLELELTEGKMLDDSEATLSTMRRLRAMGVSLAVDDFGTGWSSLSYLRRLPLDRLKIDHSFVRDLSGQSSAEAVVRGIQDLARSLGLTTVAEGVENLRQKNLLLAIGCSEMQGFLFSRPLLAADVTALLRSTKACTPAAPRQPVRVGFPVATEHLRQRWATR